MSEYKKSSLLLDHHYCNLYYKKLLYLPESSESVADDSNISFPSKTDKILDLDIPVNSAAQSSSKSLKSTF